MSTFEQTPDFDYTFEPPPVPTLPASFDPEGASACMATIPRRISNVEMTIESVYDQFDSIFIYLNEFDEVPGFMQDPKIFTFQSQDYMDLNATGKVFFVEHITDGYVFTLDDDMLYPRDYVSYLTETMKSFDDKVAACVHGSILPDQPDYYYLRTSMYATQGPLQQQRFINLPGSGAFAFRSGTLDVSLKGFLPETMVDLTFGILCKQAGLPIVCVDRFQHWIQNTDREGLFQAFTAAKTHHTRYAASEAPWGFAQYSEHIAALAKLNELSRLPGDDDAFSAALAGREPANWGLTNGYYRRLADYRTSLGAS